MRRETITVELPIKLPNSARLVARTNVAHKALDAIGSPKMWEHPTRCWLFPRTRVDELVARLASGTRDVYVVEVDQ